MAIRILKRSHGTAEIACSFCHGEGIDPFGVMSRLSTCAICGGGKRLKIWEPLRECAFCGRTGVHPQTRLSCTACLGRGVVTLGGPIEMCARCNGSGVDPHLNMPCKVCRGRGVVARAAAGVSEGDSKGHRRSRKR